MPSYQQFQAVSRIGIWFAPGLVGNVVVRELILLVLAAVVTYPAAVNAPEVQEIIQRSVKHVQADWNQAPKYSFVERDVGSKRNSQPTIRSYEVIMIDGSPYRRLIAVNDRTISPGEQAEEERKLSDEVQRRQRESDRERSKRVGKYLRERQQDRAMFNALAMAFDFQTAGQATVAGHDCWVFNASPKPGYKPTNRETKVLTGMRGQLWVDKRSNQWVKVEAQVVKPVNFAGFLARVGPGTRFLLELEPVEGNLWLPKHFSVHVKASALGFINEDSDDDETYRGYRHIPQASTELQTH
jgi:hypothetical protein